jgi:hypothetical protein
MFKPVQSPPMLMPRNPVAPVAYSRFAFWQPRAIQPAPRPAHADQPDLAQRVRETGEW